MKLLIWDARKKRGMSLLELQKRTGISKSALSNYENNVRTPTMKQMELIAIALNTKISLLYDSYYK